MKTMFFALAMAFAGIAAAQSAPQPDPRDRAARVPDVTYRSAFEGYRAFADQDPSDWRKANEEVGAAGGHRGHSPDQGPGQQSSKPQPGKPESSGGPAEKGRHGGHK